MKSIFLSASIPKIGREYFESADPMLIHAAIRAFLALTLGRRHIVWGGHPSITPMVAAACDSLGIEYFSSVTLYQSRFFQKYFPKENNKFDNLILVPEYQDLATSLKALRNAMFAAHEYEAAVFIGGMNGIKDEYDLFSEMHPDVKIVAIHRPGGAAAELSLKLGYDPLADPSPTDFTQLLIDETGVSPSESRITLLKKQSPGA